MRVVYLEPFSGISGDMVLGALLDLGLDPQYLRDELARLPLSGYEVTASRCSRAGVAATGVQVEVQVGHHDHDHHADHGHHGRSFRQIHGMIQESRLSDWVKEQSLMAFGRLAEAEGAIHGMPPEDVHFHEVGAVDSIVDIVGAMIGFERLLPARFLSAPVNVGHGTLQCQHGTYPVPGPATQALLRGVPTYSDAIPGELTTPTGATLLTTLVESFGPRPLMRIHQTGYGAGSRDIPNSSNVLRVTVGEELSDLDKAGSEGQVAVIEATIDDMNPQIYGYFQEKVLGSGALDVYTTAIQMKKNRPGVKLTVICDPTRVDPLTRLIFAETTTIGIRYMLAQRRTLQREWVKVETEYGAVSIKVSFLDGRRMNYVPEYEDCRRLAAERGAPLKEVQAAALRAYLQDSSSTDR